MNKEQREVEATPDLYPNHCRGCERPCKFAGNSHANGAARCAQCLRIEQLEREAGDFESSKVFGTMIRESLDDVAKNVAKIEKRSDVCGEMIATLSIAPNRQWIPKLLRSIIDRWREELDLEKIEWPDECEGLV